MFRCAEEIATFNQRRADDVDDTSQKNYGLFLRKFFEASSSVTGFGRKKRRPEVIYDPIQSLRFIAVSQCNVEGKADQRRVENLE